MQHKTGFQNDEVVSSFHTLSRISDEIESAQNEKDGFLSVKACITVRSNRVGWFGWRYAAVRGFKLVFYFCFRSKTSKFSGLQRFFSTKCVTPTISEGTGMAIPVGGRLLSVPPCINLWYHRRLCLRFSMVWTRIISRWVVVQKWDGKPWKSMILSEPWWILWAKTWRYFCFGPPRCDNRLFFQLALSARRENVRNEEPMDPFEEIKEVGLFRKKWHDIIHDIIHIQWVLHFFDKPHTMNLVVKDADKPITLVSDYVSCPNEEFVSSFHVLFRLHPDNPHYILPL